MLSISNLIKIKSILMRSFFGRLIIKIYHYVFAIPLVKINAYRYKFIKGKLKNVKFYTIDDTFSMLVNDQKTLCRFGDGEISWIFRDSKGYFGQENSLELSSRLSNILSAENDKILIGIPDFFGDMEGKYTKKRIESRNAHLAKYYKRWMGLVRDENLYVDALITRVYNGRKSGEFNEIFAKWKNVWKEKNVIIVEGEETRFGVGNDLLSSALSVKRIIAPAENAFDKYEEILSVTKKYVSEDILVLISLGPTATVLAYDLGSAGYQSIDIGHLDIEYEWYQAKANKKQAIPGKYVNEAGGASNIEISADILSIYKSEIIEFV